MKILFDLDNTLCYGRPYEEAKPVPGAAEMISRLKSRGHEITIWTSRPSKEPIELLTIQQLVCWGFEWDNLQFGKPSCDLYVDDKSIGVVSLRQVEDRICSVEGQFTETQKRLAIQDDGLESIINMLDTVSTGFEDV